MGRGVSLVFGKIALSSESATIEDLEEVLGRILKKMGYPESKMKWSVDDERELKSLQDDIASKEYKEKPIELDDEDDVDVIDGDIIEGDDSFG